MPYDQGLAHFEIGRHLADGDGARLSHLDRARDLFDALGVRRHLDAYQWRAGEVQHPGRGATRQ
jgi:hypothetical protein